MNTVGTDIAGIVRLLNGILISVCQLLALFVIFVGIVRAVVIYLKDLVSHTSSADAFQKSRLAMGYSFSLGLGFLIGATILKTMISSRWDDIARLAAIIAVRTVLNYLLLQAISPSDRAQPSPVQSLSLSELASSEPPPNSTNTTNTAPSSIPETTAS